MTRDEVLAWLGTQASEEVRVGLQRYGIPNARAFGVPMGTMKRAAKRIGRDHGLARALWADGRYEARTMAVFLAEPGQLSPAEADAWCADFDSWAICDTACFHLIDRTPFAWEKVHAWAPDPREFVRRAAFALIWALSVHDKAADDAAFLDTFALVRAAAEDPRPLVRKAVDMALRATGKRNAELNRAARALSAELAARPDATARRIGRHALKELESAKLRARLDA
jgi:3-methyladenine DNA glycosylase AlkD